MHMDVDVSVLSAENIKKKKKKNNAIICKLCFNHEYKYLCIIEIINCIVIMYHRFIYWIQFDFYKYYIV